MPGNVYGNRYELTGDPFFAAGLLRGALTLGKAVLGLGGARAVGPTATAAASAGARIGTILRTTRTAIPATVVSGVATRMGGIAGRAAKVVAAGAGFELGARGLRRVLGGEAVEAGIARRHRRINPLNPKALRRAVRRLSGFHHAKVSVERSLRHLAPSPARSRRTRKCR